MPPRYSLMYCTEAFAPVSSPERSWASLTPSYTKPMDTGPPIAGFLAPTISLAAALVALVALVAVAAAVAVAGPLPLLPHPATTSALAATARKGVARRQVGLSCHVRLNRLVILSP